MLAAREICRAAIFRLNPGFKERMFQSSWSSSVEIIIISASPVPHGGGGRQKVSIP